MNRSRSSQGRAHQPLEHAVHRFGLPALSITREMQSLSHLASLISAWWFVGTPPDQRRNKCPHAAFETCILVSVLSVVTGIQGDGFDGRSSQSLVLQGPKVLDVGARAAGGHDRQDQMAGAIAE